MFAYNPNNDAVAINRLSLLSGARGDWSIIDETHGQDFGMARV